MEIKEQIIKARARGAAVRDISLVLNVPQADVNSVLGIRGKNAQYSSIKFYQHDMEFISSSMRSGESMSDCLSRLLTELRGFREDRLRGV